MGTPIAIDYVTKDYEGFLKMMKDAIPTIAPEWTNYTEDTDPGMVILQLAAYGFHVLSYYQDKAVMENLLPAARTRKAILMLSRFLGYEPYYQSASTVTVEFTKDSTKLDQAVTIPAKTKISTDPSLGNVVIFETDSDLTIPAGTLTGEVTATQGQTETGEAVGFSDGTSDQSYHLIYTNVLVDTLSIKTNENGVDYKWSRVDSFVDSSATDRHYMTAYEDDGLLKVTFGNGTTGMKVPYDVSITADYRRGGGKSGNVGSNKINTIVSTNLSGVAGVINPVSATGGADAESLNSIRSMAPRFRATADRAVTPSDFELLAETISGIYKARCLETFNANMEVQLYLATSDGTAPSTALKSAVKTYIEDRMIMNQNLVLYDAAYKNWNLNVTVYIGDNVQQSSIKTLVETSVSSKFSFTNYTFGDDIYMGLVSTYMFGLSSQIKNLVINNPADVITEDYEIPKLVTLTVTIVGGVVS